MDAKKRNNSTRLQVGGPDARPGLMLWDGKLDMDAKGGPLAKLLAHAQVWGGGVLAPNPKTQRPVRMRCPKGQRRICSVLPLGALAQTHAQVGGTKTLKPETGENKLKYDSWHYHYKY